MKGGGRLTDGLCGYGEYLAGNREEFGETVTAYNKRLIYYIGGIVRDLALAEDLAADTFVKLLMKKPVFTSEEQLCSWLYKVARNLAFDALKHSHGGTSPLEEAEETEDGKELLSAVLDSEEKEQLHKGLSQLSPDYRDVLLLFYFEGFSYAEIGKVMKKSEKQVKNLAYRARQSLKEKLEGMGFVYEER